MEKKPEHVPDHEYFSRYVEAVENISKFPFSDLTIKRQAQMLLSSISLLLVTKSVISLESASKVVKFEIKDEAVFILILMLACFFIMSSFLYSAWGEIKSNNDTSIQGHHILVSLSHAVTNRGMALHTLAEDIYRNADELSAETESLIEEDNKLWKAHWSKSKELSKQLNDALERKDYKSLQAISDQSSEHHDQWDEEMEPYNEIIHEAMEKRNKDYERAEKLMTSAFDAVSKARQKMLLNTITSYKRLSKVRIALEVLVPILISSSAIIISIYEML